jgi:hypothetical protein
VLAIGTVTAWLAGILRALGAAVDAAEVVVHAEARPLAASRAALELLRSLLLEIYRRTVLRNRAATDQQPHQENRSQ